MSVELRPGDLANGAPDEAAARRRAERLFDAAAQSGLDLTKLDPTARRIAQVACQSAPYLATLLARDPHRLTRVAADPFLRREKPYDVFAAEMQQRVATARTPEALRAALRHGRGDELVRLGFREMELRLDVEVGRELSRLADVAFEAAIAFHDGELRARYGPPRYIDDSGVERDATLVVIGMGKLGGEELNFSSDVDVIYIYSSDQGEAGPLSLHEYFAKLCTGVTTALAEVTEDDVVFRVDLRLRPEGAKGAIANSVAQTERYYETFGRPWERQAWIKARPCAGDRNLGAEIMAMLRPFVFPRIVSATVIDDVRDLNRRIKRELVKPRTSSATAGFDLKNGEGGIREIEFFVQALQLIHAGKRPQLRIRSTLAALDALLFAGLVTDDEHLTLSSAYRWLRHAEHVLQLEGGLQTQTLPDDDTLRLRFAQRLGYASDALLATELATHTSAVSKLFATLGDGDDAGEHLHAILAGTLDEAAEIAAFEQLGFVDVTAARAELVRARRNAGSPLAPDATERQRRLGVSLLAAIAASADPDQALRFLSDLIARRGEQWSVWRLLHENPAITQLVGSLLGASAYLARVLVDTPELIDLLVELGLTSPSRDTLAVTASIAARLAETDASDPEAVWSTIAAEKNGNVLRVGLADFAGALDPLAVCAELTSIAESCLGHALAIVEAQLALRHGRPTGDARLAVLGLGKLGGRELGYAADLDVVFVFTGEDERETDGAVPIANIEFFSRCAQRLLGALHLRTPRGRLYEVDTRLRPSGSQGLLVTSLAGWRRYHQEVARQWERQALTKLRPVAGDPTLGEEVARLAAETVYSTAPESVDAIAEGIYTMRLRVERELAGGSGSDLKTGAGGVMDIEFAAQYLQLAYGHAHAELRTTSTSTALRAAARLGLVTVADVEVLDQGYRFLRRIEHRLRVVNDQPIHRLPESKGELDKLARRSGFPDGGVLATHVSRWQREIRDVFLRLLARA